MTDDTGRKRATAASFDAAAAGYLESGVHREGADLDALADWCADADRVIDVATGGGHTAGAVADRGVEAIATDLTPEMTATATANFGVPGVVADAERLPFADGSFDAATCRIAAHHFPDPEAFVAEVARVLEPGGTFAFEDNVAPADADLTGSGRFRSASGSSAPANLADFLDRVERVRDPTHVESYTVERWCQWLEEAGFAVEECVAVEKELDYAAWVERTDVPPARRRVLEGLFHGAPDEVREAFDVETDGRGIESFSTPKVLIRARATSD